jgi:hypothetical protein
MALLGAGTDYGLFKQDYSGFVNAANTNANAMAGLGKTIANTATDYFKDQNEKKKLLKQSSTQIDAAIKLYPELQGAFAPILDNLRDENISLNDRFASASATPGLIELAIGQSNKNRDFGLKSRELDIQQGNYIAKDRASQAAALSVSEKLELKSIDVGGRTGVPVLVNAAGDMFSAENQDPIVDMVAYANGTGGTLTNNLLPGLTTDPKVPNPLANMDYSQIPIVPGDVVTTPDQQVQAGLQAGVTNQQAPTNATNQVQAGLNVGTPNANAPVPLGRPIAGDSKAETPMTAQQVQDLAIQGFKINARPLADGSFMVSGADIGGAGETVKIITGEEAKALGLKPENTYEVKFADGKPTGYTVLDKAAIPTADAEKANEASLRAASDAAYAIKTVNELTSSPGFSDVFGAGIGLKHIPGTVGFDADVSRKAIVALATTDSMRKFQGLGSMSDAEFSVARSAATQISEGGISETKAAEELNRLRNYFSTSIRRAEELGRVPKGTSDKMISEAMAGINKTSDGKTTSPLNSTKQLRIKLRY